MATQYDRFQGDPSVFIDEDGAYMIFKGGQPVMDQGIENAVKISLHTKPGWWGNALETEDSKKIGSDYELVALEAITIDSPAKLEESANRALKWMVKTNLAKYDVVVTNPNDHRLDTLIVVEIPGKDIQEFLITKNGLLWKAQAQYPANERE